MVSLGRTKSLGGFEDSGANCRFCVVDFVDSEESSDTLFVLDFVARVFAILMPRFSAIEDCT